MFDNSKVSDVQVMKPELRKENCKFVKISRDKDTASKSYRSVSFDFVASNKTILSHREFAPSRIINGTTLDDDNFKKNISLAHSRVAHISRAFLSEAEFLAIKVDVDLANIDKGWDEYIMLTAKALGVNAEGVPTKAINQPCALKVVLQHQKSSNKYFSSLPKVPPFISTANHPKEFSINPQYDVFERQQVRPDTELAPKNNGFAEQGKPQQDLGGFGGGQASTEHASGF